VKLSWEDALADLTYVPLFTPPPKWYGTPPFPKKMSHLHAICSIAAFHSHGLPFACYLQHFRATTFHLQPMCSNLESFRAVYFLQIPPYYLCTTCMLSTYYPYTSIYVCFPLIDDQWRIYKLLIFNPTIIYYPLHACMQPVYHS